MGKIGSTFGGTADSRIANSIGNNREEVTNTPPHGQPYYLIVLRMIILCALIQMLCFSINKSSDIAVDYRKNGFGTGKSLVGELVRLLIGEIWALLGRWLT